MCAAAGVATRRAGRRHQDSGRPGANLVDVGDLRDVPLSRARSRYLVDLTDLIGDLVPMPDELATPPMDWVLPQRLVDQMTEPGGQVRSLDAQSAVRFVRFAAASGARFGPSTSEPLDTIGGLATSTAIEAIIDDVGRPYALWLRTPEPVDWRRVTTSLGIRHVAQTGACPTAYARRHELAVTLALLPNADASSALLVGQVGGVWTRLPRGVYQLTLSYDPTHADLPTLRPDPAVGSTPESVTYRFVQPSGLDWPLPSDGIVLPHRFLNCSRPTSTLILAIHELIQEAYDVDSRYQLEAIDELGRLDAGGTSVIDRWASDDDPPTSKGEPAE